jgi:SecD/SecF fusion protein
MTRRAATIVIALTVAALAAIAVFSVPGSPLEKRPTLGLDLQGGLEVTLQAVPPRDRELTQEDLDRSVSIMRDRVDKLGVAEPEIRTEGDDRITIQLPGVRDPAAAAEIIGKTAKLELFDLQANLVSPSIDARTKQPIATAKLYDLLAGQQALASRGDPETYFVFRQKGKRLVRGPVATKEAALAKWGGKLPAGHKLFAVPPGTVVLSCGRGGAQVCPGVSELQPTGNSWYLFRFTPPDVPEMTGDDLDLSGTRQDFDTRTGEPIVLMQFTGDGAKRFEEITRAEAQRGKLLFNTLGGGQGDPSAFFQNFAIVLDREIRSWPSIDFEEYPGGISGSNGAQITGLDSIGEAKDLALVLQTGALPVEFRTLEQTAISATLGKDSLEEAKVALAAGLLLVCLFLLLFYRFLGVVAVIGLAVYAAALYAAILAFNVTLTLPGVAGLVLTLGVAADANVVIFERVKEEARGGRSVRAAISQGYTKGFSTIVDANVVTAITAMILFAIATSGVRGFALMLLLGTAISIVTAVFVTRALLALLAGFKWFDNPAFMGAKQREIPRWQRMDIVGRRRLWFTIAGVLIAFSIGTLVVKGLNLGIDFKGGTQISFATPAPTSLEAVRAEAAKVGQANAVIQGRGGSTGGNRYESFGIRTESLTTSEIQQLQSALVRTVDAESFGVRNVSASFSREILNGAIVAMILSFLLISLYVSARFEWRFAVPILRTIVNDGLIAIGVYSLTGREVTAATVAAFLTIIGYSIYDTMIIFDRVRENIPLMKRSTFAHITNVSLWETIPRSLVTTFLTLVPVAALFFFGGETLKDFAFAILIGIGVSAFSTIFIAAPFLVVLKERQPEFRRRKELDLGGVEEVSVSGSFKTAPVSAPQPAPAPETPPLPAPAPKPSPAAAAVTDGAPAAASASRERRRQRRSNRPHGRPR